VVSRHCSHVFFGWGKAPGLAENETQTPRSTNGLAVKGEAAPTKRTYEITLGSPSWLRESHEIL
jgi:hypothetical protein